MSDYDTLQGRIIALELITRGLMTKIALDSNTKPSVYIEGWRKEMFSSLQLMERPYDAESDRIWAQAVAALNLQFDEVAKRARDLEK